MEFSKLIPEFFSAKMTNIVIVLPVILSKYLKKVPYRIEIAITNYASAAFTCEIESGDYYYATINFSDILTVQKELLSSMH